MKSAKSAALQHLRVLEARIERQRELIADLKSKDEDSSEQTRRLVLLQRVLEEMRLQLAQLVPTDRERSRRSIKYSIRLLDGESVGAVHVLECADDPEAILKGTIIMDSQRAHLEAEIWQDDRLVARVPRRRA